MSVPPGPARRMWVALVLLLAGAAAPACGQSRLVSQYSVSIAGISIGRGELTADFGEDGYVAQGSGRASGFLRILVSGQAQLASRGRMIDGRPSPTAFTARFEDENERTAVDMSLDGGTVKTLQVESSAPAGDRVPVTTDDRVDVADPISAMLIPAPIGLVPAVCARTLSIFDGHRRYDLALSYKRIDAPKGSGYKGPVIVCAVALVPIAGHRPGSPLIKYLTGGREMELWLAPMGSTQLVGPYRFSVGNLLGDLVIAATSYETISSPSPSLPLRRSITTDPTATR
ncbi:DUF3108 domain-containing protein [Xanthobacteraceae bacterium Astr-EGSB]|uniref:DUF3108 domain-containing protein n=1 Tax=Astrobacterium formosum TaxID=3069710 RepID=UPI0027B3B018|nr:DUF3108 domain-containing protein [Xanthobacteraceae bacterium Astr-EGSB]